MRLLSVRHFLCNIFFEAPFSEWNVANLETCLGSGRSLELAHPKATHLFLSPFFFVSRDRPFYLSLLIWWGSGVRVAGASIWVQLILGRFDCLLTYSWDFDVLPDSHHHFLKCVGVIKISCQCAQIDLIYFPRASTLSGPGSWSVVASPWSIDARCNFLFQKYQLWRPPKTGSFFMSKTSAAFRDLHSIRFWGCDPSCSNICGNQNFLLSS